MPAITTDQGSLHFEVSGKGRPVVLLHGYQGSWGLWKETMQFLADSFRTYAVDFWGFGESGPRRPSYAIEDFVGLVRQFMDQMGIARAPLVGHSMGGSVALVVAAAHAGRVSRVAAISAPIVGTSLRLFPRIFGVPGIARFTHKNLWLYRGFYRLLAPWYCRDPAWADMMDRDVSHVQLEAFFASIGSLHRADLRQTIRGVAAPVLGMYGQRDRIVDPGQAAVLRGLAPYADVECFPMCGHFVMLDEPRRFRARLRSFIDSEERS